MDVKHIFNITVVYKPLNGQLHVHMTDESAWQFM